MKVQKKNYTNNFKGLRENLSLGHKVLREFNREYPHLHSTTFYELKSTMTDRVHIKEKIQNLKDQNTPKLKELRASMKLMQPLFASFEEYIECLKGAVKELKVGNCGEKCNLLFQKCMNMGFQPVKLHMSFVDKDTEKIKRQILRDHTILLIDSNIIPISIINQRLDKNTVMVDPWLNIVSRASSGIYKIKDQFQLDFDTEKIIFSFHRVNSYPLKNDKLANKLIRINLSM